MTENKFVKQVKGESRRRWFSDEYFDLILWEDNSGNMLKFHLCYGKGRDEQAFTWEQSANAVHLKVDDGESELGRYKMSPVLLADGMFDKEAVAVKFKDAGKNFDQNVVGFVCSKIQEYENHPPASLVC